MKLSSIRIQGIHNIEDKTYSLSNFNYLVGANGAGKTTVLQSIQLALLGYIPGTHKTNQAIFRHANSSHMAVTLSIDDDSDLVSIKRSWIKSNKDIINTIEVSPEGYAIESIVEKLELPIFNFNEFIGMTANKLKDWFIEFLPDADSEVNWDKTLRNFDKAYILDPDFITAAVKAANGIPASGLQQIRQFNEYLKSQLSFKKGEIARIQNTIQSLIFYEDCDDALDLDAVRKLKQDASAAKDQISRQLLLVEQNFQVQNQLDKLNLSADSLGSDADYQTNVEQKIEISDKLESIVKEREKLSKLLDDKTRMIADKEKTIAEGGICPYTSVKCEAISDKLAEISAEIELLKIEVLTIKHQLNVSIADHIEVSKELNSVNSILQSLTSAYESADNLKSRLNYNVLHLDVASLQALQSSTNNSISELEDSIIKLEANKKYTELTDKLTKDKYILEEHLGFLQTWVKLTDVNGMQSSIMNKPFELLADNITKYLQNFFGRNDVLCRFILSEKANTFSFGLYKMAEAQYIEYDLLSSGERCLFTLALFLSLVEVSDCKLPLVLVDDLLDHLDARHSEALFTSLYNIDNVQVILAGISPYSRDNAGDYIIEV